MMRFISYVRASLRLWRKQWVGVLIAVAGLSVAFAVSILTTLYAYDGLRSDAWVTGVDQLYRVNTQALRDDGSQAFTLSAKSPESIAGRAQQQFVAVERAVHLRKKPVQIRQGDISFSEEWVVADANFPDIFSLTMLRGDILAVFKDPSAVALSRSQAERLGGLGIVGHTVDVATGTRSYDNKGEHISYASDFTSYKIVAIYEDLPPNTHLVLPAVALYVPGTKQPSLILGGDFYTYLRIEAAEDIASFQKRFTEVMSATIPTIANLGFSFEVHLEPVLGMQFKSKAVSGFKPAVQALYLWVLGAVSVVLLLTAGFNFANVFTAINLMRGREMAVRRITGAELSHLSAACLAEGILVAMFSFLCSIVVALDLAPVITELTGVEVILFGSARLGIWSSAALGGLGVGLASALYPMILLTRLNPSRLLREGQASVAGSKGRLRQFLVALQAMAFVATALIATQIFGQIDHLVNRDRGYRVQNSLLISAPKGQQVAFGSSFNKALQGIDGVHATATSSGQFLSKSLFALQIKNGLKSGHIQSMGINVSRDAFSVLGVESIAELDGDWDRFSKPVALSQRDLAKYGFSSPEEALGQILIEMQQKGEDTIIEAELQVVAVLPKFRGEPRFLGGAPYIYYVKSPEADAVNHIAIHADLGRYDTLLPKIESLWRDRFGDASFEVERLDSAVAARYKTQTRIGRAVFWVAILTAILGFAGLYGMVTHWLTTRERELALRRVLGASNMSVTLLAARRMLLPVGIGALLALFPTWFLMQNWLTNYSDSAPLGAGLYGLAVILTLFLAALLLLVHTRAALRKRPARVLYHE